MSINSASVPEILRAINNGSIDDEDLVSRNAWQTICKVRARNYNAVGAEPWKALCGRRGFLLSRGNSRGFWERWPINANEEWGQVNQNVEKAERDVVELEELLDEVQKALQCAIFVGDPGLVQGLELLEEEATCLWFQKVIDAKNKYGEDTRKVQELFAGIKHARPEERREHWRRARRSVSLESEEREWRVSAGRLTGEESGDSYGFGFGSHAGTYYYIMIQEYGKERIITIKSDEGRAYALFRDSIVQIAKRLNRVRCINLGSELMEADRKGFWIGDEESSVYLNVMNVD